MKILTKTGGNRCRKARKTLFRILDELKLTLSPRKTKMGELTHFHFLGVNYAVPQSPPGAKGKTDLKRQKIQVLTTMHPRSCQRALDKVRCLMADAVHPAHVQTYLLRWAAWWKRTPVEPPDLLIAHWLAIASRQTLWPLAIGAGVLFKLSLAFSNKSKV